MSKQTKKKPPHLGLRIAVGIGLPLLAAAGIYVLYTTGSPFKCFFYELTGLYCTGCGAGRAAGALVHLDFLKAADYNLLFVLFAPFVAYYVLKVYIRFVFGKDLLPFFNIRFKASMMILIIVVVFTILRNIPVFPFTVLAP